MKKTLIALAVAAAVAPGFAAAEGATVSGFADITYAASSDQPGENLFLANAEVDFRNTQGAVTVGVDVDILLMNNNTRTADVIDGTTGLPTSTPADTVTMTDEGANAKLEQAFFAWGAMENLTVLGGLFNNPIGREGQDAPDMDAVTQSLALQILDGQTALYGNNVAGLAAAYNAGVATVTIALLDDLGLATDSSGDYESSIAAVVNATPMEGLDLELGYVTQETSAENVVNFNATYAAGPVKAAFEYMAADKVVDSVIGVLAGYSVTEQASLLARYETVSYATTGSEDQTQLTLAVSYAIADNLVMNVEHNTQEGIGGTNGNDRKDATIEFVALF